MRGTVIVVVVAALLSVACGPQPGCVERAFGDVPACDGDDSLDASHSVFCVDEDDGSICRAVREMASATCSDGSVECPDGLRPVCLTYGEIRDLAQDCE